MAAIDTAPRFRAGAASIEVAVTAAYALGAVTLAGEAAVHLQQYVSEFHEVRWIGPLFLLNAAACVLIICALAASRTRVLGALAGVVTSVVAIASLVVSYGRGLFGWHEAGFRAPIGWALLTETGAVILLTAALAGVAYERGSRIPSRRMQFSVRRPDDESRSVMHLRAKERSA